MLLHDTGHYKDCELVFSRGREYVLGTQPLSILKFVVMEYLH